MSDTSKLKVEIEAPEHGWTHVKLSSENQFYEFFPSDVPFDSISELAKAILEILNGNTESEVYWNDEPVIHKFVFAVEKEQCDVKVYERFETLAGEKLEERFNFKGTKYKVLHPFWKAFCDMKSRQSLEQYKEHWGNSFPINEVLEIKQKLKFLRNEQF